MEINTAVYGDSTQWLYDGGISYNPTSSETLDTDLIFYCGKHRRIDAYTEFEINKPIDYSICYCAHAAAEKMPLADIAAVDYQGNVVATQTDNNAWFMTTNNNVSTSQKDTSYLCNAVALAAGNTTPITRSNSTRWFPSAALEGYTGTNTSAPMRPIVSFPLRGFYGAIQVEIAHKTNKSANGLVFWLNDLENAINTYKDDYYINAAYLRLYAYTGGGKSGTNYADFAQKNVIAWGAGFNKPLKIGTQNLEVMSYSWASRGLYNLPIFGTLALDKRVGGSSYTRYFGTQVYPYDYSTYGDQRGNDCAAILYGYSWGEVKEVLTTQNDSGYTVYCLRYGMDITTENIEKIRKGAAAYGIFFTDYNPTQLATDTSNNTRWYNEKMCLGVLDDDNIGHGEYTRGLNNVRNKIWDYTNSTDSTYNPDADIDPNTYSNTTGFNSLSGGASANQRYVLNDGNVRQLLTDLWTITHNIADVDYDKFDYKILDNFLVTDPISSIVSLKRFPFDIPHTFSPSKTNVCLGKNEGTAQGYLTYDVFNSVSFSGVSIYPKFGRSFLDFAPYTEYELYIPFCSTVKLNASEILDHVLSVRMNIDLISGVCVAYIMADDLCIETVTGSVSADMQIAGTDAATADAAIQNAVINHISARTNKEVSMLSPMTPGGLMSVVMNPVKQAGSIESAENSLAKANYDITHINTPVHSMGSAGGLSSWIQEFNCRLIIYYPEGEAIDSSGGVSSTSPKLADLTAYAHNTGFACVMNGTVSQYHGLTVGNIDTSSIQGASEEERNMIKTLFSQGVWLP